MDKTKSKTKPPNPIRRNMDYGPEWQDKVKILRDEGLISSRDKIKNGEKNG